MQELISTLKQQIVEQLNLKHIKPEEIGDDQPLFVDGLGLDSIDALELIVLLQQKYGIKLANPEEGTKGVSYRSCFSGIHHC
jgi:acyl carrier protein